MAHLNRREPVNAVPREPEAEVELAAAVAAADGAVAVDRAAEAAEVAEINKKQRAA
jgi:hypothetical protein